MRSSGRAASDSTARSTQDLHFKRPSTLDWTQTIYSQLNAYSVLKNFEICNFICLAHCWLWFDPFVPRMRYSGFITLDAWELRVQAG